MGLFDGYDREQGSAYAIARTLDIPILLVVDTRSAAYSSQVILNGKPVGNRDAYDFWRRGNGDIDFRKDVCDAFDRLSSRYNPIEEEDSVALARKSFEMQQGMVNVAVVMLQHLSNYTDFDALERDPRIHLFYTNNVDDILKADIIILPGTKSTLHNLYELPDFCFRILYFLRQIVCQLAEVRDFDESLVVEVLEVLQLPCDVERDVDGPGSDGDGRGTVAFQ